METDKGEVFSEYQRTLLQQPISIDKNYSIWNYIKQYDKSNYFYIYCINIMHNIITLSSSKFPSSMLAMSAQIRRLMYLPKLCILVYRLRISLARWRTPHHKQNEMRWDESWSHSHLVIYSREALSFRNVQSSSQKEGIILNIWKQVNGVLL